MTDLLTDLSSRLAIFTTLDYLVLSTNLLLFIFSKPLISAFKKSSDSAVNSSKLWSLRAINVILFLLYFSALFIHDIAKPISLTGLSLLVAFLCVHFLQLFILHKFGRIREIDGTEYRTETYQSEMFGLMVMLITVIAAIVIVIHIWGLTDWLKATSVLGVLALIIFSTKDVWAPDNINGLILLYNGDIEPGSVIRVDEYKLLAITMQITLTQTIFRDLLTKHVITLPNSKLRDTKVEVLSKSPASGLLCFVEFNLAYGLSAADAEQFLEEVWELTCEKESAINPDKKPSVRLVETGDHAVRWRLGYWIKNVYAICEAELSIKRIAYEHALREEIKLETPLTHVINIESSEPAK
jgi:small-conductance mechanosensitive channel